VLLGGTISLLAGTVGTPECRPARGAVVVLEDVNEPLYRLDGMLTQLLRSGWFDGARGIVLGSFHGCGEGAEAAVAARLGRLGLPLLTGLPFGHGTPQLSVPLGVRARLDVAAGTVTLREPALR
jgi:muramoyltetrapeptide carboxypeptidase